THAHLDKHPLDILKQRAEALSARINAAYQVLLDPLSRARFLLQSRHGISVTSISGAKLISATQTGCLFQSLSEPAEITQSSTAKIRMYVLGIQEEIEEAPDETTIERLQARDTGLIGDCVESIAGASTDSNLEQAVRETVRLRYLYVVQHGLKEVGARQDHDRFAPLTAGHQLV
ncbi:hypothetical protein KEM52_000571, partial [Ascosphaera acerosa]